MNQVPFECRVVLNGSLLASISRTKSILIRVDVYFAEKRAPHFHVLPIGIDVIFDDANAATELFPLSPIRLI